MDFSTVPIHTDGDGSLCHRPYKSEVQFGSMQIVCWKSVTDCEEGGRVVRGPVLLLDWATLRTRYMCMVDDKVILDGVHIV